MLHSMRKLLDRYQKWVLVALAGFLMVVFSIPMASFRGSAREPAIGTLYGRALTKSHFDSFVRRWQQARLDFVSIDPFNPWENRAWNTFLLLQSARHHGIAVGSGAVDKMVRRDPPQFQRIEYILADPALIAEQIDVPEKALQARYDKSWKDKGRPFKDVKDEILKNIQRERAPRVAAQRIRQAARLVAAAPRRGPKWRYVFNAVAKQAQLKHTLSGFFSEQAARNVLSELAERRSGQDASGGTRELPDRFKALVFSLDNPVGKPSPVLTSGDKRFIFRVVQTSAGYTADGTLVPEDWAWRNDRFVPVREYRNHREVLDAKRRMDVAGLQRTFEEFLVVHKLVALACSGSDQGLFITRDAAQQALNLDAEQVKGLLVEIPVRAFRLDTDPSAEELQRFYDARKERRGGADALQFGYFQPPKAQIEYARADPADFVDLIRVTAEEVEREYETNQSKYLADDGKTPRPLPEVRRSIIETLKKVRAKGVAERTLKRVRQAAEAKDGEPLDLRRAVERQPGVAYVKSPAFSQQNAAMVMAELAESDEFTKRAFSAEMRPRPEQLRRGADPVRLRPMSPILESRGKLFFFRLVNYVEARPVELAALTPREQDTVRANWKQAKAAERAVTAARKIKTEMAQQLLKTIAEENKLSVQSGLLVSATAPSGATPAPEVLRKYMRSTKVRRDAQRNPFPGEIARLIQDGETCYTAVAGPVDPKTKAASVDYVRFAERQFTAALDPSDEAIEQRALAIRDAELKKKETEEKKTDKDKPPAQDPPPPTEAHKAQAKAELLAEWKKKAFKVRYLDYLAARLQETFRRYAQAHPIEITKNVALEMHTSPDFFRAGDEYVLRRDKGLVAAALKLKPDTLTGPVAGDSHVALMLLAAEDRREEVKMEFVSVQPDRYDPLDAPVSDAEARQYYDAHPDDFRLPARAQADVLFASFDDTAAALEKTLTAEAVEKDYELNKDSAYKDRALDAALRKTIRERLARHQAQGEAKKTIDLAAAAVKAGQPLAAARRALGANVTLADGKTHLISPKDDRLDLIGYAPALVKQILAAKVAALSKPVKTEKGWVIYRVARRTESTLPAFADTVPAARAKARQARFAARARKAIETMRAALAKDKEATLAKLLKRPDIAAQLPFPFGAQATSTGFLSFEKALDYPGMTSALRRAAFDAKPGAVTNILDTDQGLQLARVLGREKHRVVKVHFVALDARPLGPLADVTDADAKKHYDAHQADYRRHQRVEVEYLIAQPWQLRDETPTDKEIQAAYQQLQGQYVDEQASRDGPTVYLPLDKVRDKVIDALTERKSQAKARAQMQKALDLARKDAKTTWADIEKAVKGIKAWPATEHELTVDVPDIPGLEAFLATAKAGDVSPILRSYRGPILARVKTVTPAGVPPLDDVKAKVRRDVALLNGLANAKAEMAAFRKTVKAPGTAAALGQAAGQYTVKAVDKIPLKAEETEFKGRRDFFRQSRSLLGRLLAMRAGEISEPPVIDGEKAERCLLAVLAGVRKAATAGSLDMTVRAAAFRSRAVRLTQLVRQVQKDFRAATQP